MKRMMSIAMIALFVAGASAFACDSCGCSAKKDKKASCCAKDGKECCKKGEKSECSKDGKSCSAGDSKKAEA